MKISLLDWKRLEAALVALREAIEVADSQTTNLYFKYHRMDGCHSEAAILLEVNRRIHSLRENMVYTTGYRPQSEWMGGDSKDPKNHKLREPNCCPMPRRYFTTEELVEAGAVCHGPVQWSFADVRGTPDGNLHPADLKCEVCGHTESEVGPLSSNEEHRAICDDCLGK